MRGITLNSQDLSLSESNRFEQVQFGGCPAEVVSGVRFMGDGMAEFQPYMAPIISVAFHFKTEQLAGILFEVPCTNQPANNQYLYCSDIRIGRITYQCHLWWFLFGGGGRDEMSISHFRRLLGHTM